MPSCCPEYYYPYGIIPLPPLTVKPPANPIADYNASLLNASEVLPPFYTGDDITCSLPLATGVVDAASTVEAVLVNTNGVAVTTWALQTDLANGNDFSSGKINILIPNALSSLLGVGRFQILIRIISAASIQQTYRTYKIAILAPPI